MSGKNEWLTRDEREDRTDGDDIVICKKPAEDVGRYSSYAEEVQDEEHDGVRGLIQTK